MQWNLKLCKVMFDTCCFLWHPVGTCWGVFFSKKKLHNWLRPWHICERRRTISVPLRQYTLQSCALLLLERSSTEDVGCWPWCSTDVCVTYIFCRPLVLITLYNVADLLTIFCQFASGSSSRGQFTLKSHFFTLCFDDWQCSALQVQFHAWRALNSLLLTYLLTYIGLLGNRLSD